jgi:hypothetical protein
MSSVVPRISILKVAPRISILKKILLVAACVLTTAWLQTPLASAQHVGHPGGGGHVSTGRPIAAPRAIPPPASHAPISRAPVFAHPPLTRPPFVGAGVPRFGFHRGPILFPRRPVFFGAPFFAFRQDFGFNYLWWINCGPLWEFGCNNWLPYEYPVQNNFTVTPPLRYETPVYVYGGEDRDLVQLYLKDGTVYSVTDYWFVNSQIHFTMLDEETMQSVEQVIGFDELDLQKTINVNTRRGFRLVMRDEPMDQYLRDHPDPTPPLLQPPPKN